VRLDATAEGVKITPAGKQPGSPKPAQAVHWYPPGPVARSFLHSKAFIAGIMGPFGSGKSVTVLMKLIRNMQMQVRAPDGWVYRRTLVARNTYPELRTTTMNTFFQWLPKERGHWRDAGPPTWTLMDQQNKIKWEVLFVAFDRPDDVAKALGFEFSDAWLNEAREIPKAILDAITGRVGRYPATWQGGCTNPQIMMDTNPPDTDHWWYVLAERDMSTETNRQLITSMLQAEDELRLQGVLDKGQQLFEFFRQPGGRSPAAENLRNLRAGYYTFLMAGKDQDFIKVYVDGEYGFVMDGLPVFPEYKDSTHAQEFPVLAGLGFRLGFDWGLTPAATVSQRTGNGLWLVHDEFVSERLGIPSFASELMRMLKEKYPGVKFVSMRGDPAGDAVTPEESTCFKIMKAAGFTQAEPAPTQDPTRRREAVAYNLRTMVDGVPALRIHKRCNVLRKGLAGGYHRKRLKVTGDIKYRDVPDKNKFSHVCEALEYDMVSAGEDRAVTLGKDYQERHAARPQYANADYDEFGD
jgi:hypothetical protein